MQMLGSLIFYVIMIGAAVGLCFLQVRLSKKESKIPGLILPIVNIGFGLVAMISLFSFSYTTPSMGFESDDYRVAVDTDGNITVTEMESGKPVDYYISDVDGEPCMFNASNDEYIMQAPIAEAEEGSSDIFGVAGLLFIELNIPTVVYLIIYFVCRSKMKKNAMLDKMVIQDI